MYWHLTGPTTVCMTRCADVLAVLVGCISLLTVVLKQIGLYRSVCLSVFENIDTREGLIHTAAALHKIQSWMIDD